MRASCRRASSRSSGSYRRPRLGLGSFTTALNGSVGGGGGSPAGGGGGGGGGPGLRSTARVGQRAAALELVLGEQEVEPVLVAGGERLSRVAGPARGEGAARPVHPPPG